MGGLLYVAIYDPWICRKIIIWRQWVMKCLGIAIHWQALLFVPCHPIYNSATMSSTVVPCYHPSRCIRGILLKFSKQWTEIQRLFTNSFTNIIIKFWKTKPRWGWSHDSTPMADEEKYSGIHKRNNDYTDDEKYESTDYVYVVRYDYYLNRVATKNHQSCRSSFKNRLSLFLLFSFCFCFIYTRTDESTRSGRGNVSITCSPTTIGYAESRAIFPLELLHRPSPVEG